MSEEVVIQEYLGPVARLVLNRQSAMNALNLAMVDALESAMAEVAANDASRVLLLTGAGPAFCAGADLKEALQTKPAIGEPDFLERAGAMMNRLRSFSKPVIVALNGVTMAGGLELAMCADIILAAEEAKIADAHANFGVYPGAGGAAILPRMVPLQTAMYMLLSGKSLTARRLHDLGLIAELHPAEALGEAALALAQSIAGKSPAALRRMKLVARSSADKSSADALLHEQVMLRQHLMSEDMREGLRAFAEKRAPRFTGR